MRLLAFTPIGVPDTEIARRQARYDAIAPGGMQVVVRRPAGPLPEQLGTVEDLRASEAALLAAYSQEPGDAWDGFLPDCVLDPVVGAGVDLPAPVHGIGRLAMHALAGAGLRWRAVARNDVIAAELDRLATDYGTPSAGPTAVLSLSVTDIADEARWAAALSGAVADLTCDAVLNGCSAVDVAPAGDGPVVVDPTALALRVLAEIHGLRAAA